MHKTGELDKLYARIKPERIHFLRFILEGYDGMALLSTISPKPGVILLHFHPSARNDMECILDSLAVSNKI